MFSVKKEKSKKKKDQCPIFQPKVKHRPWTLTCTPRCCVPINCGESQRKGGKKKHIPLYSKTKCSSVLVGFLISVGKAVWNMQGSLFTCTIKPLMIKLHNILKDLIIPYYPNWAPRSLTAGCRLTWGSTSQFGFRRQTLSLQTAIFCDKTCGSNCLRWTELIMDFLLCTDHRPHVFLFTNIKKKKKKDHIYLIFDLDWKTNAVMKRWMGKFIRTWKRWPFLWNWNDIMSMHHNMLRPIQGHRCLEPSSLWEKDKRTP